MSEVDDVGHFRKIRLDGVKEDMNYDLRGITVTNIGRRKIEL